MRNLQHLGVVGFFRSDQDALVSFLQDNIVL